jgi:flagellar basal body-associated protein FliL
MMKSKKTQWIVLIVLVSISILIAGSAYYYFQKIKTANTETISETETPTVSEKESWEVENDLRKNTVIQNSPRPEGFVEPNYVEAPTPPAPPAN